MRTIANDMFDPTKSLAQHVMTCRWMLDIVQKVRLLNRKNLPT